MKLVRYLLIFLLFSGLFVLPSCSFKTNKHRKAFGGIKTRVSNRPKETFLKKNSTTNSTYYYNKRQRRVKSKPGFERVYGGKGRTTISNKIKDEHTSFSFRKRSRSVSGRQKTGIFTMKKKHYDNVSFFNGSRSQKRWINIFGSKNKKITRKNFLIFNRRYKSGRETSRMGTTGNRIKGGYSFNPHKRRVIKKKFLFIFNRHVKERETSTFRGGESRKLLKFHVFSKRKKQSVKKKGLFRRKMEKRYKRKKNLEPGIFSPRMKVKI